jgi:antitoxin (DNA-binding transcriptional repressor) of toxin-antitoxin stability system
MKATLLEMRRNPRRILEAIARNETVTLTRRGVPIARIEPVERGERGRASEHEAFGMWADRAGMSDPSSWVREQRKRRFDAL